MNCRTKVMVRKKDGVWTLRNTAKGEIFTKEKRQLKISF